MVVPLGLRTALQAPPPAAAYIKEAIPRVHSIEYGQVASEGILVCSCAS